MSLVEAFMANGFDVLVFFVLFAGFLAGWIQGALRRLIGVAAMLFALLVAANSRGILAGWLGGYWTSTPRTYVEMLSFGIIFVALAIVANVLIQSLYQKVPIVRRLLWIDDLAGAVLGVVEAAVVVAAFILVLDTYYRLAPPVSTEETALIRHIWGIVDASRATAFLRSDLLVSLAATVGAFLPPEIRVIAGRGA